MTWGPAPFAPTAIEMVYSPSEDITRLRFVVADPTSLRFEMIDAAGTFRPVDFNAAPYPSGSWSCGGATCYQLAVRGYPLLPSDKRLLRAVHDDLGAFGGEPAKLGDPVLDPVQMKARVAEDDRSITVEITDWLAAPGLERPMRFGLWPEALDRCEAHPERADESAGLDLRAGSQAVSLPSKLGVVGRYCASARPLPRDRRVSYPFATELLLFPITERRELRWQPPSETAPIVWKLVPDLEIVDPARCAQIGQRVHDAIATSLGAAAGSGGTTALELPLLDLSPACHHSGLRALDVGAVADEVKKTIAMKFGSRRYHRPLLFYLDNLDAQLPQPLVESFDAYRASFVDGKTIPGLVGLVSASVLGSYGWDFAQQYAAIEDPQFLGGLDATLRLALPLRSELHDNADIIPLMSELEAKAAEGWRWKVCQASPAISRLSGAVPVADEELTPAIEAGFPPGFRVVLPPKILLPAAQFASSTVVIRYELCKAFCDNPFHDETGTDHMSWAQAPECVRNEVP